jgi:hypothetical protein
LLESEAVNSLSDGAGLFMYRFLDAANAEGQVVGDYRSIRSQLFPKRRISLTPLAGCIKECHDAGVINYKRSRGFSILTWVLK